jgi:hypothetical protein
MPQQIENVKIRDFSGISVKINATDQLPGTMRRADGVNTVPARALSFGPAWTYAWNSSALGDDIASALSGATADTVAFVTIALGSTKFLVAWNVTSNRPRGIFQVAGTGDPDFESVSAITIVATNDSVWRDHTDGLDWYGSWNQDELWLGNGTDTNLVWAAGALSVLGPATQPSNPQDPSQFPFPPCKTFLVGTEAQVYGTGNVTYPLRVWCAEPPSVNFPLNRGLKTTAYSWVQLKTIATRTTALSSVGTDLIVHYEIGPPSVISGFRGSRGGWKLNDGPTEANASAINPNCSRDNKVSTVYLGTDLELYRLETYKGSITSRQYNTSKWRKGDITTDPGSSVWNEAATKPISGNDYAIIEDQKNGRVWAWLNLSATDRQGLFCFDDRTNAITGPWFYPDFLSVCQLRDENLSNTLVCGITRDGAFLWADLQAIGDFTPAAYTSSLPAACAELTVAPTATPGVGYVGVSADGQQFKYVLNGQTISMATPWSEWAVGDVTCTKFYDQARVAVIEFAEGDCSLQAIQKEFATARTIWNRNSVSYMGVYAEVNGYRYGGWRGLQWPSVDWLAAIGGEGSTYKLRLIIVTFNSYPSAVLSGIDVGFFQSVMN